MQMRNLLANITELSLARGKMAFISGPRQTGKTTLARQIAEKYDLSSYKNWDNDSVMKSWSKDPELLLQDLALEKSSLSRLLILDEIHKSSQWKRKLKGLYDLHHPQVAFLVTGSARLNVYQKGGDSLLGRYFHFRLHPFSLGELISPSISQPDAWLAATLSKSINPTVSHEKVSEQLLRFSGFPEPFLAQDEKIHHLWRKNRRDLLIKEDLRDLNRVQEISQLQTLALLLPEKVGSPLSVDSLREDLSASHPSVTRWLKWFEHLYIHFEIKPWIRNIKRSLKKEGKIYLYDWTEVEQPGARFENFVACHLLKACHIWSDLGYGDFTLHYLRNKEKEEIDFLIVKNKRPWLACEAKLSESKINSRLFTKFHEQLNCPIVQISNEKDIAWSDPRKPFYSLSAERFLRTLP